MAHTDSLAIGKWVSVEERLPEFDPLGVWDGYCRVNDGAHSAEASQWDKVSMACCTHWLDLSLPEQ